MKNAKLILSILTLLLFSCDPEECGTLLFVNGTNLDLTVTLYAQGTPQKTLNIPATEQRELAPTACSKGGPKLPDIGAYDSILVLEENGSLLVNYKPESTGKNPFNWKEDWQRVEDGKRSIKYVFEISQEAIPTDK